MCGVVDCAADGVVDQQAVVNDVLRMNGVVEANGQRVVGKSGVANHMPFIHRVNPPHRVYEDNMLG